MGVPSIIVRYFPFFRTEDKTHGGFALIAARLALIGFIASTAVFFILKPLIISGFTKKAHLFVDYYYYLVPLAFFTIFFNFLEAFGKVIYQSIYSAVLKEVVLRILTTIAMVALAFTWINFEQFIAIYIAINGLICLCLFTSLTSSGQFSNRKTTERNATITNKQIVNFGLFTLLSTAVYILLQNIDKYMLSAMAGLTIGGVYSLYSNVAMVISVPAQALSRTTYQIVADSWKSKNMAAISEVYSKTSIIQMVAGCLLFIGIIVNKDNMLAILKKKYFYDQYNVLIVICLGFLVDITGGLNTYIITTSHKYRLITALVSVACVVCIGLTYILIPRFGGMGAAGAYLITITGINFCTWFYIKVRFKMQPFTYKHLIVIFISGVTYLAGNYFWRMPNVYLDIIVRSLVTAIIYGALSYVFQVSNDLNEKINSTIKKLSFK
jgi:O-antigen/teichoic acid export membrane protein